MDHGVLLEIQVRWELLATQDPRGKQDKPEQQVYREPQVKLEIQVQQDLREQLVTLETQV